MKRFLRINNLSNRNEQDDYSDLAKEITSLVNMNLDFSNDATYDDEAFARLKKSKKESNVLELIRTSLVICVYEDDVLVACGFVTVQDERFFSKSLHVHPMLRGKGLGRFICNEREKLLKKMGVDELYIESVKFPSTLKFHRCNGFKTIKPYKELKNTILMKKYLR